MVKSLFILTTMIFSDILKLIGWLTSKKEDAHDSHGAVLAAHH
jgi:uncharacterized sodium:solute symporter family permease YidK